MLCRTTPFLAISTKTPCGCSIAGPPPTIIPPAGTVVRHYLTEGSGSFTAPSRLMEFNLSTISVARRITASHPLCEESKHLPMPSGVNGPSHKALNLSLSSQNLGYTNKACPTSSLVSGHVGHSALPYTPILFR